MKTKPSAGLFSGLPQKAQVLGAQFIRIGTKKSFQISYIHNGQTCTQSISKEGGKL